MRKVKFVPGEWYHLFNRTVDGKKVFLVDSDFLRAFVCLVAFNSQEDAPTNLSRFVKNPTLLIDKYTPDNRNRLVDIAVLTLLPTQYHFFVRERIEGGISRLMHRFDKGVSRYFNLKNNRSGSLWQGAFGAKHVDVHPYSIHIVSYIHLNILDLYAPGWREGEIENWSGLAPKLIAYPWSSYAYYRTGKSQVPFMALILTSPEWFSEYYPEPKDFEESLRNWSSRALSEDKILFSLLGNDKWGG